MSVTSFNHTKPHFLIHGRDCGACTKGSLALTRIRLWKRQSPASGSWRSRGSRRITTTAFDKFRRVTAGQGHCGPLMDPPVLWRLVVYERDSSREVSPIYSGLPPLNPSIAFLPHPSTFTQSHPHPHCTLPILKATQASTHLLTHSHPLQHACARRSRYLTFLPPAYRIIFPSPHLFLPSEPALAAHSPISPSCSR